MDQEEIEQTLKTLCEVMRPVLEDGARKRESGLKPHWTVDEHEPSLRRHLNRWDRGEYTDPDSGAHPLAHAMVRCGMQAWQEMNVLADMGNRDWC